MALDKKNISQSVCLLLGIIVSWIAISTEFSQPFTDVASGQFQNAEDASEGDAPKISLGDQVVTNITHFNFVHDLQLLLEINPVEENETTEADNESGFINSLFQTLFRRIISINAP